MTRHRRLLAVVLVGMSLQPTRARYRASYGGTVLPERNGPPSSKFGNSVAMSGNNRILAVGTPSTGHPTRKGQVRVYFIPTVAGIQAGAYMWDRYGRFITTDTALDGFGTSVALSFNGTLVIGVPGSKRVTVRILPEMLRSAMSHALCT